MLSDTVRTLLLTGGGPPLITHTSATPTSARNVHPRPRETTDASARSTGPSTTAR